MKKIIILLSIILLSLNVSAQKNYDVIKSTSIGFASTYASMSLADRFTDDKFVISAIGVFTSTCVSILVSKTYNNEVTAKTNSGYIIGTAVSLFAFRVSLNKKEKKVRLIEF